MTEFEIKQAVRDRDGYKCTECGMTYHEHIEKYNRNLEVHRLIPGGDYTIEGCVTLCRPCHGSKPKSRWGSCPRRRAIFEMDAIKYYALGLRRLRAGTSFSKIVVEALKIHLAKELQEADEYFREQGITPEPKPSRRKRKD